MPVYQKENENCPRFSSEQSQEAIRTFPYKRCKVSNLLLWCALVVPLALSCQAVPSSAGESFSYKNIINLAESAAKKPYQEPKKLPDVLSKITYDQWRNIRFKPEDALWRKSRLPFEVQFFHPGWLYNRVVDINIIASGKVKPLSFSPDLFHYGMNVFQDKIPKGLGFAGFRLQYPINTKKYFDEVVVFLGASYFRAVGRHQNFGLSVRGAAIDTAMDSGEEFPFFKEFWLVRPEKKAKSMTVFALLDSPSLAGAYRFIITPGKMTLMETTATLFLRKEVKKLGIAPLNSMFFYGENRNIRPVDDFRPEIHDSDGLQINTDTGEWIWRPLINPKRLLVTSFALNNPKGFGLFQRDRNFDHYQDLEANYQKRPSVWIVPGKGWGKGRVELVEIPTDSEKNDNIVSYWVPAISPKPGSAITFSYKIEWGGAGTADSPLGQVVATRTATDEKEGKIYLIDFQGGKLDSLTKEAKVKADVSISEGKVIEQHLQNIGDTHGWRLVFKVKRDEGTLDRVTPGKERPLELRAFLRKGNEVVTETWSYVDPF